MATEKDSGLGAEYVQTAQLREDSWPIPIQNVNGCLDFGRVCRLLPGVTVPSVPFPMEKCLWVAPGRGLWSLTGLRPEAGHLKTAQGLGFFI